jgi:hypothetical protein
MTVRRSHCCLNASPDSNDDNPMIGDDPNGAVINNGDVARLPNGEELVQQGDE